MMIGSMHVLFCAPTHTQLLIDDKPISYALNRSNGILVRRWKCVVGTVVADGAEAHARAQGTTFHLTDPIRIRAHNA